MWEIGDRVVVTKAPGRTIVAKLGYKGTVIDVVDTSVLVEFDKYIGGHSGSWSSRNGKFGHCYWLHQLDDADTIGAYVDFNLREEDCVCKKIKRKNNFY